LCSNS